MFQHWETIAHFIEDLDICVDIRIPLLGAKHSGHAKSRRVVVVTVVRVAAKTGISVTRMDIYISICVTGVAEHHDMQQQQQHQQQLHYIEWWAVWDLAIVGYMATYSRDEIATSLWVVLGNLNTVSLQYKQRLCEGFAFDTTVERIS